MSAVPPPPPAESPSSLPATATTTTTTGDSGQIDKATAAITPAEKLLDRLGSSSSGLDGSTVGDRQRRYGPNVLTKDRQTAARVFVRQFESPLVYFLAVASALSYATKDASDGTIIVAILAINAVLGFSQEYRSERAVEHLASLISDKALVRRDGAPQRVRTAELVPGDVVELRQGDVVPADVKLIEATDVQVDESQLTGESVQVPKSVQTDSAPGDGSLLFTGSVVGSGKLTGVVYATGDHTAFGQIATLSRGIHKVTQYEKSLRAFSTRLMLIVLECLAVTVVIKLALNHGSTQIVALLVFVVALAVSVVPEALPVIATLTMARGAVAMAKDKVVVKRLSSLEDLGDVTMLCTDKTGTLTEGKLTVTSLVSEDDDLFEALVAATIQPGSGGQEGTQGAYDAAFEAFLPDSAKEQARGYSLVSEVPFDPAARRRRVLLRTSDGNESDLVVIGAVEMLLGMSECPDKAAYLQQIQEEGRQGMRHLGVAYRKVAPGEPTDPLGLEHDLHFLGFVSLSDPLRDTAADTIARAKELGLSVKILTGDSVEVAAYVGEKVGLVAGETSVLSGAQLASLSGHDLDAAVAKANVFARVSPEQKFQLIKAFKRSDVVGYEGDGINDAPSLKLADVGIAVDSATDVARASADIILLQRLLSVIINGIRDGRAIFVNINKYIVYTMVGNLGNFIALSLLYLAASNLPLLPRQLLLMSLLTDVPLLAISTDSVDESELTHPSQFSARRLLKVSLVLGTLTAAAEILFFLIVHNDAVGVTETALYLFLSFTQLVVIFEVRNEGHFWTQTRPSKPLLAAMAVTGGAALGITYLRPAARLFSFTAPSGGEVALVLGGALVYLLALDLVKVRYYKFMAGRKPSKDDRRGRSLRAARSPAARAVAQ